MKRSFWWEFGPWLVLVFLSALPACAGGESGADSAGEETVLDADGSGGEARSIPDSEADARGADAPGVDVRGMDVWGEDTTVIDVPGDAAAEVTEDLPPHPPRVFPEGGWLEPEPWAEPIADYIEWAITDKGLALDAFDHGVKDLAVFDGRMCIGYGDWTNNLGPVQVRCFNPDGSLDIGPTIDEESIDYYRVYEDRAFIPGVDPRQPEGTDPLTGNVTYKEVGGEWTAVHQMIHCLHVLDVIRFGDAVFACGSGNTDMDAYNKGDDMGVIWRSDDQGKNWSIETEWHDNIIAAVVRFERFVQTGDNFYVLGEYIDYTFNTLDNVPRRYDGGTWTPVEVLPAIWVQHTHQFTPEVGIVIGADISASGKKYVTHTLQAGEKTAPLTFFADRDEQVLDYVALGPGEGLFLSRQGASLAAAPAAPYTYHVYHTLDLAAYGEVLTFTTDELVLSLAWFGSALYLGTGSGIVLRATSDPE